MRGKISVAVVGLVLLPSIGWAQGTAVVRGRVTEAGSGNVIAAAQVSVSTTRLGGLTDND